MNIKHLAHKGIAATTLVCLLGLGFPQPARASAFVGATELTQIANFGQLSAQYGQQIQQYLTQCQQYATQLQRLQMEITNVQKLGSMKFTNIQQVLTGLQGVVQNANALSYSMANMDSQFVAKFPAFGSAPNSSYSSRYAAWSQTTNASIQGSLDMAHLQNANLSSEVGLITTLQQQAQTTQGTVDSLQVGNQIAAEEVNQLMELRQLMMADMSAKAAFQAQQTSQQDEQQRSNGFFAPVTLYNSWTN